LLAQSELHATIVSIYLYTNPRHEYLSIIVPDESSSPSYAKYG
jgi:hypothetical protein